MHAGVLPLNCANLVAAGPLLEAERHVIVVPLGPDDQGLLLLLVCGVRLDLGLEQHVGDEWCDNLALHSDHLQNPMMEMENFILVTGLHISRIPPTLNLIRFSFGG